MLTSETERQSRLEREAKSIKKQVHLSVILKCFLVFVQLTIFDKLLAPPTSIHLDLAVNGIWLKCDPMKLECHGSMSGAENAAACVQ